MHKFFDTRTRAPVSAASGTPRHVLVVEENPAKATEHAACPNRQENANGWTKASRGHAVACAHNTTLETQSPAQTHCRYVGRKQSESAVGVYAQQGHMLQPRQWWSYAMTAKQQP
jgi:hypothetical protein